ncbi:MAG TPA: hypothetical protein VMM93_10075, partial [Vicinamibacterales bacterium]|nr:hypothetical protein [Vicinamibacterales bacterium]
MALHVKIIAALYLAGGVLMLSGGVLSSVMAGALAAVVGSSGNEGAGVAAALLSLGGAAMTMALVALAIP